MSAIAAIPGSLPISPAARRTALRYAGAIAVGMASVLLRFLFDPVVGQSGFAITLVGMLVAAWVGGVGPALIVQTLLLYAQAMWFAPEHRVHSPMTVEGIVSLAAFYSVGVIVGGLSEAWQASRQRLRTQSHEAFAQRERLRTILACMADGVLVTDVDGRLTLMNPTAERMTGWMFDEALGKSVLDIFVVADEQQPSDDHNPVAQVLRRQQVLHRSEPLVLKGRQGGSLPISYSAAPIYDAQGQVKGIVLIVRDETTRRQAERDLLAADQRKDQFLATLAHELRNPLAPIVMGLQLLKEEDDDPQANDEIVDLMDRQARHMVRLIDDLLDVSRITRGKLDLRYEPVELADIVQSALEAVRPSLEEAGHLLEVQLPAHSVTFEADPNRLTQVLSNLLDNAIKYTPAGGRIELIAEPQSHQLVLSIRDNGHGIPAEKLTSIFEMFMQLRDKMEQGHKGLGIGLTLVKQLVEMHGGTITVESEGTDRGSTFRVTLPLSPATNATNPAVDGEHPTAAGIPAEGVASLPATSFGTAVANGVDHKQPVGHRVLVVDDNADALRSLTLLVSRLGNETHQACDGEEAVEAAARLAPDVVLMDIGMPKLNGYEAARQIRRQPWGASVMLVATTGWGQEEDRRRTKEAGFDYHLVKPIDPGQLKELLATLSDRKAELKVAGLTTDERLALPKRPAALERPC